MEGVESTVPLKKRQPSSQRPISLGPSSSLQPTEEEPEARTPSGSSKKRRETDRHGDGYGGKVKIKKEREDDAQIFRNPGMSTKTDELRRVASTPAFSKDGINGKQSRYGSTKPPTLLSSSSRPSSVFGMPLGSSTASISPPLTETSSSPPPPTSSTSLASQDSDLQRSRKRSSQTFSSPSGYLKFQDDLKQATATKPQHQHQRQRSSASVSAPTSGSRPTGAAETSSSATSATAAASADVDVSRKKAKTSTTDNITEHVITKQSALAPLPSAAPVPTEPIATDAALAQSTTPTSAPPANVPKSVPPGSNSSIKERASSVVEEPVKELKVEEAVNVVVKAESPPPAPRSVQDAQRYLPLYTVQLSNEVDQVETMALAGPGLISADSLQQQQQYFCVVDRQVQLLLGLTEPGSLYSRYPHLHRRLVTTREKDRLWSPLSSMVSDRCAAAVKLNYEVLPAECQFSSWSTATTAMSRLKEHEKQKFLGCDLYFIRLDEVTELIRRDFPQLDDSMMTITLDIGYDEEFDMETDQDLDLDKVKKEDETLKTVKEEVVEETVHLTTTSASLSSSVSTITSFTSLASSTSSSSLSHQTSQGETLSAATNVTSGSSGARGFIHKLRRVPAKMATKAMFKELQQQYHRHP